MIYNFVFLFHDIQKYISFIFLQLVLALEDFCTKRGCRVIGSFSSKKAKWGKCGWIGYTGPTGRTGPSPDPSDPTAYCTHTSLAQLLASSNLLVEV